MRALLAVTCLALLSAAFAGCLDDPERYPNGVPTTSSTRSSTGTASGSATATSTGSTGNGTGGGNGTGNQVPLAELSAAPVNGSSPLNVTFSLDGSDPDDDALNWTLSFGDGNQTNGTELPTTVVHEYTSGGNFTAVLRVIDAAGNVASANATVAVSGAGSAAPDPHCHRTPTEEAGPFYVYSGDGGDWVLVEDNGIAGLQVANNHPGGGPFHNPAWVDCVDGDLQMF